MHVGVAEAGENDAPRLGLVIAIRIGEENKLRRTANIRAAFHRHHRMRHGQPLGKHRVLVRDAVLIGILQNDDAIVWLVARLDVRIGGGGGHPRAAARIPVEVDRILDHRIGGKEIQLEALGHGDRLELSDRIGSGNVFRHLVIRIIARRLPLLGHTQLVALRPRRARLGDDLLLAGDEFVEVLHLLRQMPHLVPAKEENIRFIDRPQFVAVQRVLFHDQLPQVLGLLNIRPGGQHGIFLVNGSKPMPVVPQFNTVNHTERSERRARGGQAIQCQVEPQTLLGAHGRGETDRFRLDGQLPCFAAHLKVHRLGHAQPANQPLGELLITLRRKAQCILIIVTAPLPAFIGKKIDAQMFALGRQLHDEIRRLLEAFIARCRIRQRAFPLLLRNRRKQNQPRTLRLELLNQLRVAGLKIFHLRLRIGKGRLSAVADDQGGGLGLVDVFHHFGEPKSRFFSGRFP